jgi:hypothetical protein
MIEYTDRAKKRSRHKVLKLVRREKTSQTAVTTAARQLAGLIWGITVGCTAFGKGEFPFQLNGDPVRADPCL